tara:strand:+ start:195 stop:410 length:216 start_codon:yes stop_codon:yes gene_type:complete
MKTFQAEVKLNPIRIRVPEYGNGLMLLMEIANNKSNFLGNVTVELEGYFDIEIRGTKQVAQDVKKYINLNL